MQKIAEPAEGRMEIIKMNSNELLSRANQRVVDINKIMGEIEDFDGISYAAQQQESEVAFYENGVGTTFLKVLSDEKKLELKAIVLKAITDAQAEKTTELEQLLGVKKKPAIINPEFEKAIKEMEQQNLDPVKEELSTVLQEEPKLEIKRTTLNLSDIEDVRRMYHDEGLPQGAIAEYYGVTKPVVNNFIYANHLAKKKYAKGYLDSEVEQRRTTPVKETERP